MIKYHVQKFRNSWRKEFILAVSRGTRAHDGGEAWEQGAGAGSRETTSSNTILKQKYEAVSSWGIVNHTVNPKFVFVLIN